MSVPNPDPAFDAVVAALLAEPNLTARVGDSLRLAFDEVIDGQRTGRYKVEQLEKTEKTYIGTKVEIVLRDLLELERGKVLDNLIQGHEVDTKFTLGSDWMIPREAIGHLCILIKGEDNSGLFSLGVLRMTPSVLRKGKNQDKKGSVSAAGKKNIHWIVNNQQFAENLLLKLPSAQRIAIMTPKSGRQRILALFRNVRRKIIPRSVIPQVAQQRDSLKRAREAKGILANQGIQVLCSTYVADRQEFVRHGFTNFRRGDWLSI